MTLFAAKNQHVANTEPGIPRLTSRRAPSEPDKQHHCRDNSRHQQFSKIHDISSAALSLVTEIEAHLNSISLGAPDDSLPSGESESSVTLAYAPGGNSSCGGAESRSARSPLEQRLGAGQAGAFTLQLPVGVATDPQDSIPSRFTPDFNALAAAIGIHPRDLSLLQQLAGRG